MVEEMKISAGKIIYFALLILMIFLTVRFFNQSSGAREEVEEKIVILEDTKRLEENEGKLVLLTGKMIPKDTLKFEEYGVEVNSPILERKVEMYQYVSDTDEQDREIIKREWSDDTPEEEIYDEVEKETYYNPDMKVESDTLYGEAYIGNFFIDKDIIKKLKTNTIYTDLKEVLDFKIKDGNILTNVQEDKTRIGNLRIQFKYLDLEKAGEYTIVGKQSGDKIVEYKLDTGLPILKIFEGTKTKEEVLEGMEKDKKFGTYGMLGILILLILIGISRVISNMKKDTTVESDTFKTVEEKINNTTNTTEE